MDQTPDGHEKQEKKNKEIKPPFCKRNQIVGKQKSNLTHYIKDVGHEE